MLLIFFLKRTTPPKITFISFYKILNLSFYLLMLWMCSKWLNFRIKKLHFSIRQKMIKNNFILIPQWLNFRIKKLHFRIRQKIGPFTRVSTMLFLLL